MKKIIKNLLIIISVTAGGVLFIYALILLGDYFYSILGQKYFWMPIVFILFFIVYAIILLSNKKQQKNASFKKTNKTKIPLNPISSNIPPKTNFQNFLIIPHIESLINYFVNHEKQISLINSDCIISLFQKGYVPASEEFNNPQKMSTIDPSIKINNPQKWLLSRLWLDLINLKNISEKTNVSLDNIFVDYLNNLGPKIDQTLIAYGTLAQKYNIEDLEGDWEEKINRLADKGESESFKINYVSDALLSAEVRIIAWIYKELFNKEFKFKK